MSEIMAGLHSQPRAEMGSARARLSLHLRRVNR